MWDALELAKKNLEENRELAKEDDEEIAEMANMEIPDLEATIEKLAQDVQYSLLPRDEAEDRDALLEIRSGAGGDEAAIFAGDLFRMYARFAERKRWPLESPTSTARTTSRHMVRATRHSLTASNWKCRCRCATRPNTAPPPP